MKPSLFAELVLHEAMSDMRKKYNNPDIKMRTRPAKPSEILALQRRINKAYGHPFLMQDASRQERG